jgi:hypothetical protein
MLKGAHFSIQYVYVPIRLNLKCKKIKINLFLLFSPRQCNTQVSLSSCIMCLNYTANHDNFKATVPKSPV